MLNWRSLLDPVEWRLFFYPLTHDQLEMIEELEKLSDHVETVRKGGYDSQGVFPILFFERDNQVRAATIHRDGDVSWGAWTEKGQGKNQ